MSKNLKRMISHLDDVIVFVENRKLTQKEKEELKKAINKHRADRLRHNSSSKGRSISRK